ncbi:MAG: cytochrome c peroxidase [Methylococcaceae bacterium]
MNKYYCSSVFLLSVLFANNLYAHGNTPPSLQGVVMPATAGLLDGNNPIVIDKTAAIQLGKALFWDTAVGSDGMACASCHFHAGADSRTQNQLSTGALHNKPSGMTFQSTASGAKGGVNYALKISDFPLYQLLDPSNKDSKVLFNSDDVVSSAGVFSRKFGSVSATSDTDTCTSVKDKIFHQGALNTRKVQNRQAPSVINAGFNFRNFWDGRANNIFNGVSAFGGRDVNAGIWVAQTDGSVSKQSIRLENASLASQAVAPPLNDGEMSCTQRTFPDIGRKLLTRQPLAGQEVHAEDSVLASLRNNSGIGLNTNYEKLIKTAFAERYWSGVGNFGKPKGAQAIPYKHIEANFSFFFGLALQLYQQTLVSDQTPFDSPRLPNTYPQIPSAYNDQQSRGLKVFLDAHCALCHRGPTLSAAAHPDVYTFDNSFASLRLVNRKTLNGAFGSKGVIQGIMDEGYFNTSVTPEENDLGIGGTDPFGNPLSFSEQYIQQLLTGKPLIDPIIINSCDLDNPFLLDYKDNELIDDPTITGDCADRALYAKIPTVSVLQKELAKKKPARAFSAIKGAFKVPSLRNVELTGPYMHNGSLLTLEQVVDFYFRGGNFKNNAHFATVVFQQFITEQEKADLVVFLKSLTDERVRWERAPFDHPALKIPHGQGVNASLSNTKQAEDLFLNIPAIGKNGRDANLGALQPFEAYLQP